MKTQFIATLAIVIFSAQAFAVVMPGAPARNAYVFKKDFENAQKKNAAARLAAKDKKTSTAIAKSANDGVIDLALLDDETNRDDKYRLSAAGTNIAANNPNAGTGDPTVIGTENPPGGGGGGGTENPPGGGGGGGTENPPGGGGGGGTENPPGGGGGGGTNPPGQNCGGNCGNGGGNGGGNGTGNEAGGNAGGNK